MLFALGREGYFPAAVARTHRQRKVPTLAILITSLCIFVGAVLAFFNPGNAYVFVASLSSFGFLYAWLMIPLAQVLNRRGRGPAYAAALRWRVPLYPLTPAVAIIAVLVAFVGQFFFGSGTAIGPITIPGSGITVVVGLLWTLIWALYYVALGRTFTHGEAWRSAQAVGQAVAGTSGDAAPTTRTR
jgi:L-asparagine transporter-like permease